MSVQNIHNALGVVDRSYTRAITVIEETQRCLEGMKALEVTKLDQSQYEGMLDQLKNFLEVTLNHLEEGYNP